MTAHKFVGNFWIRQRLDLADGKSKQRFFRPAQLHNEHPCERLIAATLLGQKAKIESALAELVTADLIDWTVAEISEANLEPLFCDRIRSFGMETAFSEITLQDGTRFFDWLARSARRRTVDYDNMNDQFHQLLEELDQVKDHIVWLKGVVLSRTSYESPYHRPSQDFDIVVRSEYAESLLNGLLRAGYHLAWFDNFPREFMTLVSLKLVCAGPCTDVEYSNEIQAMKAGASLLEIKFDPLKSGLRMKEIDRFFRECETINWEQKTFLAPSAVDHLMIELFNMHRRGFKSWPWLYDVHLLSTQLSTSDWHEFVRRCKDEDISLSAWAGLDLAQDRLNSSIPEFVMEALRPTSNNIVAQLLTYAVGTRFVWNEKGMGELVLNSLLLGAARRKSSVMVKMLFPSPEFLSLYYWGGEDISSTKWILSLAMHWLLIFFPRAKLTSKIGRAARQRHRNLAAKEPNI